jgi:hypothetical protein
MFGTRPEVVLVLRAMALNDRTPTEMLHAILSHHPDEEPDRNLFCQYFAEAFRFTEGEVSPIFGWLPDGTGELQDANIDYLMTRRIRKNRGVWETTCKPAP